jgi:4-amino-4-deoxy-L-arabinose transferase-like glycosyltransferase
VTTRLAWLPLAAALVLGWGLGGHHLLDPDEGRNAEVSREMAQDGDWIVPHLDGLPYLDKPVAYFAAAAAAMLLLGPGETAARLPAYLATLATMGLLLWFARRRWGEDAGWLAALALATMAMPLAYARAAIFDSALTLCTTAAMLAFAEERPVLAWAAMGVGVLTKGPVALLIPLAVVVPWALLTGGHVRRFFAWRGLLAFAAVALPWFLTVSMRIPQFPEYVFVRETWQRVTTAGFHRTGPWWYYLPILPVVAFPWVVPALARLRWWRWGWLARRENPNAREAMLLACWVIVPLAFFSLNQSKLPQYVLPLLPAVALTTSRVFALESTSCAWRATAVSMSLLGVALVSLTRWLPAPISLTPAERAAIPPAALVLGAGLLVAAGLLALGVRRRHSVLVAAAYALPVALIPFAGGGLLRAVAEDRSAFALAAAVRDKGVVVGVGAYPPSLPFYLRQRVRVAAETGRELTSTFIADYIKRFRDQDGSPLLAPGAWAALRDACAEPTIFVFRADDRERRATMRRLPMLYENGRYAAYGPCRPPLPGRGG